MNLLLPRSITDSAFLNYGQPITPVGDLTPFGTQDAQLFFDAGAIRFYVMLLEHPGLTVTSMARHTHCSQCLASADAQRWWLAVAAPELDQKAINTGSLALFRIEPRQAIKLHPGTWHAGPYFSSATAAFYNLELASTKVTDQTTCDLGAPVGLQLQ